MKPFSALTGRERTIERLRWVAVLPAAVLGGIVASLLMDLAMSWSSPEGMLKILMLEFPKGAAIVLAGALTAPRWRVLTAMILAVLWVILSIIIHLLLRQTLGWSNYLAVLVAAVAAITAAAFISFRNKKEAPPHY